MASSTGIFPPETPRLEALLRFPYLESAGVHPGGRSSAILGRLAQCL